MDKVFVVRFLYELYPKVFQGTDEEFKAYREYLERIGQRILDWDRQPIIRGDDYENS